MRDDEPDVVPSTSIFTGMNVWTKVFFALGFPSLIALVLLWFVLDIQKKQNDSIHASILANQQLLIQLINKFDDADRSMRSFALQSNEREERVIKVLFRICYQNANTKLQSEECLKAIQ